MTETAALLRALHCDLAAITGLLAAMLYNNGETNSHYNATISASIQNACAYYDLADELEEKEGE